ncbi:MAG: hypothetical protein NVV63_17170 [Opitutus sp.]|nr:hypothetical protein [Opitutus sp.]
MQVIANGNMTGDGVRTYSYDGENRLIKVTQGSSTWHYVYDYLGRRIEKRGTGITSKRRSECLLDEVTTVVAMRGLDMP